MIWKSIPSLPGYEASEDGQICGPRKVLSQFHRKGYACCEARGQKKVSRLVCEAFHGPPPSAEHHAAHWDGNRANNRENNLRWATVQENADDLAKHASLKGEKHPLVKLSANDVRDIKSRRAAGESIRSIHKSFSNVCYATLSHICNGRNWRHI